MNSTGEPRATSAARHALSGAVRPRRFRLSLLVVLTPLLFLSVSSPRADGDPAGYRDFRVRIAVVREAEHVAFGVTEDCMLIHASGREAGRVKGQQLYFVDLTEGGLIILRDAGGRTVASDSVSLLMRPAEELKSATYLEAIRDVSRWRAGSLREAPSYRGSMRFGRAADGSLAVVNELPIEHYLLGVVGPEIGNFAPDEALKAQAVAARSETWAKLQQGYVSDDPLYDFTDTSPQVYRGWREENQAVRRAIDATRGEILVWHGQPIDAVYGHSCGGVVAEVSEVWGGAPLAWSRKRWDRDGAPGNVELQSFEAAHGVTRTDGVDAWCSPHQDGFPRYAEKHFRWRRAWSAEDLTRMIDPVYRTGAVRGISILKRSASGRVQRLRIEGAQRNVELKRELHIRGALGNLKSTFFTMTTDEDSSGELERVYIYGAGYGHGVGMCQMGAYMLAKGGRGYRDILTHYFSGVSFDRLYP